MSIKLSYNNNLIKRINSVETTNLSITEKYMLCTLNNNGNFSGGKSYKKQQNLVAAALMELWFTGCGQSDAQNRFILTQVPSSQYNYLLPLCNFLAELPTPSIITNILLGYLSKDGNAKKLFNQVGTSLSSKGVVLPNTMDLFGYSQTAFQPHPVAIECIIQELRRQFLLNNISNETSILIALLEDCDQNNNILLHSKCCVGM